MMHGTSQYGVWYVWYGNIVFRKPLQFELFEARARPNGLSPHFLPLSNIKHQIFVILVSLDHHINCVDHG